MKVTAIIQRWGKDSDPGSIFDHKAADIYAVKQEPFEACCEEMGAAVDGGFVGFGDDKEDGHHRIPAMCIYRYSCGFDHMPIARCPWCGEPITVTERDGPTVAEQEATRLPQQLAAAEARVAELRQRMAGS